MRMNKRWVSALLAASCCLGTAYAAAADPVPTAFHAHVMALSKVDSISLAELDRVAIAIEDAAAEGSG